MLNANLNLIGSRTSAAAQRAKRWGLVSYWNLENVVDSYGGNVLTNNGSVTFPAGKIGNAAQFNGSSNYLNVASNSGLQCGNVDLWVACWVNGTSFASFNTFVGKRVAPATAAVEYLLRSSSATPQFITGDGNTGLNTVTAASNLSTSTWTFLLAWQDVAANAVKIQVNAGAIASATRTVTPQTTVQPLFIGGAGASEVLNGMLDSVAFGKSPPGGIAGVITEIHDTLYNSGNGRSWPI